MTTTLDFFKQIKGDNNAIISRTGSYYHQVGDKLIRVSNHECSHFNLSAFNEGIKEIFMVFIDPDINDSDISDHCEEVHEEMEDEGVVNVDYITIVNGCDILTVENALNRVGNFLQS